MLESQLSIDLNNQQTQMLVLMQDFVIPDPLPAHKAPAEEASMKQAAKATIGVNVQLQMLQILQAMQATQAIK